MVASTNLLIHEKRFSLDNSALFNLCFSLLEFALFEFASSLLVKFQVKTKVAYSYIIGLVIILFFYYLYAIYIDRSYQTNEYMQFIHIYIYIYRRLMNFNNLQSYIILFIFILKMKNTKVLNFFFQIFYKLMI